MGRTLSSIRHFRRDWKEPLAPEVLVQHVVVEHGNAVRPLLLAESPQKVWLIIREPWRRVARVKGQASIRKLFVACEMLDGAPLSYAQENTEDGSVVAQHKLRVNWGILGLEDLGENLVQPVIGREVGSDPLQRQEVCLLVRRQIGHHLNARLTLPLKEAVECRSRLQHSGDR